MFKRRSKYYIGMSLFFLGCCLLIAFQPNKFQKWNSIKYFDSYEHFYTTENKNVLPVEVFVKSIPYKNMPEYVYMVNPPKKYERTIQNGYGDCSTMAYGAAYYFLKNNIPFELIHFLPKDTFLSGGGHVALRVLYNYKSETKIGILDLIGGGLPSTDGNFIDIDTLAAKNSCVNLHRINEVAPASYEEYYKHDYLKTVYFGFTPSNEVEKYFNFIETFYVPIGNEILEKYLYDGMAILFNQYYSIYVNERFLDEFRIESLFYIVLLQLMRIYILFILMVLIFELFYAIKSKHQIYSN